MTLPIQGVGIRQRKHEEIQVGINTNGTIFCGSAHVSCVRNSAGNYTITLLRPSLQNIFVVGVVSWTANLMCSISTVGTSAFTIAWVDNDGTPTATDAKFYATLRRTDDAQEY